MGPAGAQTFDGPQHLPEPEPDQAPLYVEIGAFAGASRWSAR